MLINGTIKGDAGPGIIIVQLRVVENAIAALHMQRGNGDTLPAQPLYQGGKVLYLLLRILNICRAQAIRHCQVGVHTLYLQRFHAKDSLNSSKILIALSLTVHAGIYFKMHPQL